MYIYIYTYIGFFINRLVHHMYVIYKLLNINTLSYVFLHICRIYFERGCCPNIHGLSINGTIGAQEVGQCNRCLLSALSPGSCEARIRRKHRGHDMFCIIFGALNQQKIINHQVHGCMLIYVCTVFFKFLFCSPAENGNMTKMWKSTL